jgi:hypothetical protein
MMHELRRKQNLGWAYISPTHPAGAKRQPAVTRWSAGAGGVGGGLGPAQCSSPLAGYGFTSAAPKPRRPTTHHASLEARRASRVGTAAPEPTAPRTCKQPPGEGTLRPAQEMRAQAGKAGKACKIISGKVLSYKAAESLHPRPHPWPPARGGRRALGKGGCCVCNAEPSGRVPSRCFHAVAPAARPAGRLGLRPGGPMVQGPKRRRPVFKCCETLPPTPAGRAEHAGWGGVKVALLSADAQSGQRAGPA